MDAIAAFFDALLGLSKQAHDLTVAQVCLRAVIVYVVLVAYIRFGKKRFLSEATAFDAVLIIIIGSLSSRAVSGTAPFVASLAATWVFIAIHWVISYFAQSSHWFSGLVKGHDRVLVREGKVDRSALRQAHMSPDDLGEDLRQRGVEDPAKVKEARLERSGTVSVIKKRS